MKDNKLKLTAFTFLLILLFNFQFSFAETDPVMITYSDKMSKIIFDGKWTFFSEWKESSLNGIGESLKIRSAHLDNFIYIFVDVLKDNSLDVGSDRAIICFDTKNNKSIIPDNDDYCFIAILERDVGFTLQGGSAFATKSYFQVIPNHEDLIAIGASSDNNDRYLKSPHPSYEFKIPTELINRSNYYGFYVEAFDAKSGKSITWPPDIIKKNPTHIPEPEFWGDMISIDKSLPEFSFPILILIIPVITLIIMSRKLNYNRLTINTL